MTTPEDNRAKCKASEQAIFEHNKGIFHLGQCPDCFQSNVINPPDESEVARLQAELERVTKERDEWERKYLEKISYD